MALRLEELAKTIDHTLLRPTATVGDVDQLCEEAREYHFASVCVLPYHVAHAVDAPEYDAQPIACCGYYSYFSGIRQDDLELYVREHHAFGGAPTNDGLHIVIVNWPARLFTAVRADVEGHVWRALASAAWKESASEQRPA